MSEVGKRYYEKKYNLPDKVEYCTRCVNSNQRPRITFDEKGVCSACNFCAFSEHADMTDSVSAFPPKKTANSADSSLHVQTYG